MGNQKHSVDKTPSSIQRGACRRSESRSRPQSAPALRPDPEPGLGILPTSVLQVHHIGGPQSLSSSISLDRGVFAGSPFEDAFSQRNALDETYSVLGPLNASGTGGKCSPLLSRPHGTCFRSQREPSDRG